MMIELIMTAALGMAVPQASQVEMPERYRKWLEEEVVYIISEKERKIFRELTTNEQRDRFIEEFWLQRDPTPGTERNEFKEEHYRRIEYANKWLGRETAKPGWKTDQGRIYIQLGEPKQKRSFYGENKIVPCELWFYEADPTLGVPPFFNVIFFKKWGVGDLILYDPTLHGPESLIFMSAGESFEEAASLIADIDVELAMASINLVPTEQEDIYTAKRPSLASIQFMSQLENLPNYHRDAEYAERILRGEPRVETRYTFSETNLPAAFLVIKLAGGDSTLNYSFFFPAGMLDYGQYNSTVYAALEIVLTAMNSNGKQVATVMRALDQQIKPEQLSNFKRSGLAFEDNLLLLPGDYEVTLTVRNKVSRVLYMARTTVEIPPYRARQLEIGEPVLYDRSTSGDLIRPNSIPPFAFYSLKFHPMLAESIAVGQQIGVFYQVYAPKENSDSVNITYKLVNREGQAVKEKTFALEPGAFDELGTASVFWKFDTGDLQPGDYSLEITAEQGGETAKAASRVVSLGSARLTAEPLTSYGSNIDFTGSKPSLEKSRQLLNIGEPDLAASLLGSATKQWPQDNELASLYADALVERGDADKAIEVLLEISLREPQKPEWKNRLGTLCLRTGQYKKAIAYFEQVRLLEGDTIEILNPLGEAYRFSGNDEKAIEIWQRSLEIEPTQPLISSRLEQLRNTGAPQEK
jgi:GWxTD domain-containing protein